MEFNTLSLLLFHLRGALPSARIKRVLCFFPAPLAVSRTRALSVLRLLLDCVCRSLDLLPLSLDITRVRVARASASVPTIRIGIMHGSRRLAVAAALAAMSRWRLLLESLDDLMLLAVRPGCIRCSRMPPLSHRMRFLCLSLALPLACSASLARSASRSLSFVYATNLEPCDAHGPHLNLTFTHMSSV